MKKARQPISPELQRLRRLMKPYVGLEQVWHEINAARLEGRAAGSTVEALMLSLRAGVSALNRPDTLRRLAELSDLQLREVVVRLQKFKPEIAPAWTAEEVEALAIAKGKLS